MQTVSKSGPKSAKAIALCWEQAEICYLISADGLKLNLCPVNKDFDFSLSHKTILQRSG